MNNRIRELMERKSTRSYTNQDITAEAREAILMAAMAAPTAGNQQMYTIIDIQDQEKKERMKPIRCRLEDIVCVDTYHQKKGEELRRMFDKECKNRTFDEWAQAFCTRKYNSDFSKEMSRSVRTYLKDWMEE